MTDDSDDTLAERRIAAAISQNRAASKILCGALGAYLNGRPDDARWLADVARALVNDRIAP